jgi:hypothetical protein
MGIALLAAGRARAHLLAFGSRGGAAADAALSCRIVEVLRACAESLRIGEHRADLPLLPGVAGHDRTRELINEIRTRVVGPRL